MVGASFSSVYAGIPWDTAEIADDAITTEKIDDKTVKNIDIRNNQIKTGKIRDGTILGKDIGSPLVLTGDITADNYFDNGNTQTGVDATALGGDSNTASGELSTVGGGGGNTASELSSTVGGGGNNMASGPSSGGATVGGGFGNTASGDVSSIGGGQSNQAIGPQSTVGGGKDNRANGGASFGSATVGGGENNKIDANGWATIAGGRENTAKGQDSTIGGGSFNTVSSTNDVVAGGDSNTANAGSSTVGGGFANTASGVFATVPGGASNEAGGTSSFAAGQRAKAMHEGAFVWADKSINADFSSTAPNQFSIRASNGVITSHDLHAGDDLFVGTDDGTDIDFIYFDSGTSEFLKWDERALPGPEPAFELSDELDISTESPVQGLLVLNKLDGEGTLQRFRLSGTTQGSITVASGTVSYNAFTGSHYAWTDEDLSVGTLVEMTGVNKFRNDDPQSEIIYGVQEASTKNSQAILGTYLGMESGDAGEGTMTPHLVMAEGNGMIWIADTGQDIQPGDYLISSVVPGHAMKDDRSEEVSHIIGRAAEPILWNEVSETIDGVKHKKISILFNSFAVNNQISN